MLLQPDQYLSHIRTESARFQAALSDCDPGARVPACPDWDAADLLWHLTEVQDFWCHVIEHRPAPPEAYTEPQRPDDYTSLLARFAERSQAFTHALDAAEADEAAWSWSAEQTVGFTFRRQALEALVHRVDAEQAAGRETAPLDPALAADCVDEALDIMFGGEPPWGRFTALPHYVEVRLSDTGDSIWVQPGEFSGTDPESGRVIEGERDIHVVSDPGVPADAVISGAAADVALWLWRRRDRDGIEVTGDLAVYDRFREATDHPIT